MDKSKPDANTLFSTIQSGASLSLHAVQANVGRWAACSKTDSPGLWIEWALEGEALFRGDRILEINGQIITCKTREELQKIIGITGKCLIVVVRKRSAPIQQQQLLQSQEDNQRLQHRISYLEDQVKGLLSSREGSPIINGKGGTHITSISISSPIESPTEKPQIFQRGNYVTTIIGGKPVDSPPSSHKSHITKTIIKEVHQNGRINGNLSASTENHIGHNNKVLSASKISINSDITHLKRERHREKELRREEQRREEQRREEQRREEQRREDHRREDQRREDLRREDLRREDQRQEEQRRSTKHDEQHRERHYQSTGIVNGNKINGYHLNSNHMNGNGNHLNGNYTNGKQSNEIHSNGKSGNQLNGIHKNQINGHQVNGNIPNGHHTSCISSRNSGRYSDSEGSNHFHGYNSYAKSVEHLNYTNGYDYTS